jgi:dynein heavy chain, axonemal
VEFAKSFEEASPSTPIFFILSPGVNPLKDVEQLGKQLGYTEDNGNFHNVSLGQGQEVVAEIAMDEGATKGHWVILQVDSKKFYWTNFCLWWFFMLSEHSLGA